MKGADDLGIIRGMNHIGLTVPDIDEATTFFKKGLDAQVAYESQTLEDPPRGGSEVERFLGIPEDSKITRKRMIVLGNCLNNDKFQSENTSPSRPRDLDYYGYNHLSFYTDDIKTAFKQMKIPGGEPLSE